MTIHYCSNPEGAAAGSVLTQELVNDLLTKRPALTEMQTNSAMAHELTVFAKPFDNNFQVVDIVPSAGFARDTKIIPSLMYEAYGKSISGPANMHYKSVEVTDGQNTTIVKYDPFTLAMRPYAHNSLLLEEDILVACAWSYYEQMCRAYPKFPVDLRRVFTFEEAVVGIPGCNWFKSIKRSSSPGYPWVLMTKQFGNKYPGKTWWFGHGPDWDFSSPQCLELRARVELIIENAKKGIRMPHYYLAALKDERRPLEKVHKPRPLEGCAQDHLLATRMLFGGFHIFTQMGRIYNGSAIGVNPHSSDWHLMYTYLTSKSNVNFIAGDREKFDANEQPLLVDLQTMYENAWYDDGPELARARQVLMADIREYYSVVPVPLDDPMHRDMQTANASYVIHHENGRPTGSPRVAFHNGGSMHIQHRYCFIKGSGIKNVVNALKEYTEHNAFVNLGDDHVGTVTDKYKDKFNMQSIARDLKAIGHHYTLADKKEVDSPFVKPSELVFLKRGFVYEPLVAQYIAPLELAVILEMPYWTKKGARANEIARENLDTAMHYLSMHDDKTWESWAPKLRIAYSDAFGLAYPWRNRSQLLLSTLGWDLTL
jgi:hypothetical protein